MFFKTLEIQGFKSFADKTVLSFDTKMTAIVGSNGNGKSNISDALRWVMGEQGAKTLRGDKMEDVIFHGTQTRKSMGFAKVALAIDNADRALAVDSDEVVITRRLYRTGESEYLLNGQKTRLKDIHEMLMGTGLGRDGYSIIGQGRVAEIINTKGKERREFFEEAAGVSKFLHKKAEAERELGRANENILRLLDIVKELEDRLPVLKRQAEKAVKAKALVEQERTLEISVNVAELRKIGYDMREIENSILMNEGECEHFEREIAELEARAEGASAEKMRLALKMEELRQLGETVKDDIAAQDKAAALMESEIIHNNARIKVVGEQIVNSQKSAEDYDFQIAALEHEIGQKNQQLEALRADTAAKEAKLTALAGENEQLDSRYKELDRELGVLYARQTEAKISLAEAEGSVRELAGQLGEAQERTNNQDELLVSYREQRRELKTALEALLQEKEETANKLQGYTRLYEAKKQKLDAAETELGRLRREHDQKKSRHDILSDVERNMAGYYSSVKAIISAAKAGKLSDIHGTVADILHVERRYSVAVEIALGAALQNIIVASEETAKRCIRFLKESNAGRATFLPLTSVKGRELDFPALRGEEGFLGLGHELVQFDERYTGIVKSILGKTAIVEDIDTATFIAKKYGYKFRIVTLDGQVVNAGGSFTGGSVKESAGIITRKQEIEAIGAELVILRDTLDMAKSSFSQTSAEAAKMALETEGFKEALAKLSGEEIRLTSEIGGVTNLIRQCEDQQDNAEAVIDRHKSQIAAQEAVVARCNAVLRETEVLIREKDALAESMGEELEAALKRRGVISDEIAYLRLEAVGAEKDIDNLRHRIEGFEQNKKNLGAGNEAYQREIDELEAKNAELQMSIRDTRTRIAEISRSFTGNQEAIAKIVSDTNDMERQISEINRDVREKMEHREKFSNALVLARERKSSAERDVDKIKAALWEKYELAPSEAQEIARELGDGGDIKAAKNELQEVRRRLSALGDVNFEAIEEFREVGERYDLLTGQLGDVEKAKADLEKLILDLTADIKTRFLHSFEEINRHFGRIFAEIFGGGSAHLALTDPEDILGSGIEIFAAPPGKLIKNLISLSGGEQTMVAITIYFAVLLHRPTPFCMLDEVDAALDEINVVKYISYLKRFSDETQLMVITHRRGTIEGCDVLYGVFMQEKGISRLLRQEITDDFDAVTD